jgi:hypothetical protein
MKSAKPAKPIIFRYTKLFMSKESGSEAKPVFYSFV